MTQQTDKLPESKLTCPSESRHSGDIVGCGSTNVGLADEEGFHDCLDCGLFFKVEGAEIGDRKLQQERQAPSGGYCEDCKWSARSGGGKCEGCLALDMAAEARNLPEGDVSVIEVASLDDEHAANFSKPFICQHEDCRVVEFDAEDAACAYQRDHRIKNGMDPMTGEAVEVGKLPEKPQLPYKLSDGRIVGKIEKIAFTQGGAGNQWTTISGEKYATWWDIRSRDWNEGDIVAFKASKAPLWYGHPPVAQASNIAKFDPALLFELADDADNETAVVRINRREYDALITSLRLLERNMENGEVGPNDGNLGDILTCSGDHRGLSVREVCTLCDNLLDGKNVTWDAKADKPTPSRSGPTMST